MIDNWLRSLVSVLVLACSWVPASAVADDFTSWALPGGQWAGVAGPEGLVCEASVPALTRKQEAVGGNWWGVVTIDLHGSVDAKAGEVWGELVDPATGEVLATTQGKVKGQAARAAVMVLSSSEQGQSAAAAFDQKTGTHWHSRYGENKAKPPHWIGLQFGQPFGFKGISYLPRQTGFTNGVARKFRLEVREPGQDWRRVGGGETNRKVVADERKALSIALPEPLLVEAFRLVIESDWSGGGFGSAAEITPLGQAFPRGGESLPPCGRLQLGLSGELFEQLEGKAFGVRIRSSLGEGVVVSRPRVARFHQTPSLKLLGKENGVLGPDRLGAGLLGFTGLLEHGVDATSVVAVREGGAAARAGLKVGDAIVAVDGTFLPRNDLAPGWNWFRHSHEAILGRAGERALAAKRPLALQVLRDGTQVTLALQLPDRPVFGTLDPASDPASAAMLEDLITWLCEHQREDGSWSGDIIRTTFSALALLATGEKEHEARVKRAVDWALQKYPKPEKYGRLGFWHGAYAGILYSEWHLRTGDKRVLAHLQSLRDWAVAGQHESIWGVPALGHGPSGLPYGGKSLVAPACHLLVYESLAQRCGMESAVWELLLPFMEMAWSDPKEGGHGGLGYNRSHKDRAEFWSRTGLFAMACHLREERPDMSAAMTSFMTENHPWIRNSHAYGEPGGAWGLLALNLASPASFDKVLREYSWWFSLAWEPGHGLRYTTPHMGAPYMGQEDLINAAYALVLQARSRSLALTGKGE